MSGDKFKKVQAGKPLEIPANTWNSMVDAARHHADQQHDQFTEGIQSHRRGDVVKVKNTTSVNINRFGILGLSQPVIGPAANLLEFSNRLVLTGVMPTLLHRGRFAVALEPSHSIVWILFSCWCYTCASAYFLQCCTESLCGRLSEHG